MSSELNASARLVYEEAVRRGMQTETFGSKNLFRVLCRGKQVYFCGSRSSFQSSVGLTIAMKKHFARKVLGQAGLPIANGGVIGGSKSLRNVAKKLRFPVVIKPLDGAHGQGVIVGIKTANQLEAAFKRSGKKRMIIEEMAVGKDFRIVVVNYQFVAAAYRVPAHVVGDGELTVAQLIEQKNKDPRRGTGHSNAMTTIIIDELVISNLQEAGLQLSSVPMHGQTVWLRKTANLSTGGEAWDVTDTVSPENRAMFERVAHVADLNTVGIDVIAPDLESALSTNGGAIIEINSSPGLRMHHYPAVGQSRDVAGLILDMVEANAIKS